MPNEMPSDLDELRVTQAKHGADMEGLRGEVGSLRNSVTQLVDKMDSWISNSRPNTFAILSTIGGAVTIVLAATQIVLYLTVGPIRQSVDDIEARLDKRGDLMIEMMQGITQANESTRSVQKEVDNYGFTIRGNKEEIVKIESDIAGLKTSFDDLLYHSRDYSTRLGEVEASNAACERDRENIRVWMEKMDNIGTRNQINR